MALSRIYLLILILTAEEVANPLMMEENREIEEKQWDLYNKWLSGTLNKKLIIIELGEGFDPLIYFSMAV